MLNRYISIGLSLLITACSTATDPEIIVRAAPEKRPPKPEYMPAEEKPLAPPVRGGTPLAPQVGIRVPLG